MYDDRLKKNDDYEKNQRNSNFFQVLMCQNLNFNKYLNIFEFFIMICLLIIKKNWDYDQKLYFIDLFCILFFLNLAKKKEKTYFTLNFLR